MTIRLATTVTVTALSPKLPPYVGDAAGTRIITTVVGTALGPKLPPFQGE